MAKFDSIRGQELMEVEEKGNEITMIFKDNRYLFLKVLNGRFKLDRAQYLHIKGKELTQIEEEEDKVTLYFNDSKLPINIEGGKLVADCVPY